MNQTINADLIAKLARIQNYKTAYEVTMSHPDGRKYRVGYTPRKSRDGLWSMMVRDDARREKIIALAGTDSADFAKKAADGVKLGEWSIRFTGRTERDCYLEGELDSVFNATV